jgi:hypothetical protein
MDDCEADVDRNRTAKEMTKKNKLKKTEEKRRGVRRADKVINVAVAFS